MSTLIALLAVALAGYFAYREFLSFRAIADLRARIEGQSNKNR
jgi:hypothetical protein